MNEPDCETWSDGLQAAKADLLRLRYSRRQIVRRAVALGLSMPAISALLTACAGGGATPTTAPVAPAA